MGIVPLVLIYTAMNIEEYLEVGGYLPKSLDETIAELDALGYFDITEEDMMCPPCYDDIDLPF